MPGDPMPQLSHLPNAYPQVWVGSTWVHDDDLTVWAVADLMEHADGNPSIVIVQLGGGSGRKAVTAGWLANHPQWTQCDQAIARELLSAGGGVGGNTPAWLCRIITRWATMLTPGGWFNIAAVKRTQRMVGKVISIGCALLAAWLVYWLAAQLFPAGTVRTVAQVLGVLGCLGGGSWFTLRGA